MVDGNRQCVRSITPEGERDALTLTDEKTEVRCYEPYGIAVDLGDRTLYVADSWGHRIWKVSAA